jgi:hypothetical protein
MAVYRDGQSGRWSIVGSLLDDLPWGLRSMRSPIRIGAIKEPRYRPVVRLSDRGLHIDELFGRHGGCRIAVVKRRNGKAV